MPRKLRNPKMRRGPVDIPPAVLYLRSHGEMPPQGVPGRPATFRLLKAACVPRNYWLSVKDQAPPMSWAEEEFGADNTRPVWVRFMSPATGYLLRYGTPRGDRFALSAAVRRAELEAGANRWHQWRRTSK